jgi:peptidoglycan/xylan/chitin deacetylase (PgdA/CDA1 family)
MNPIPVLLYHSVDEQWTPEYRRWCVDPGLFAEHLAVIDELGFTCVSVSELVDAVDRAALPPRPLAITFDDGRADFATHAAPLLEQRSMPATIYLVTGCLGGTSSWMPMEAERDKPMMSWSDVESLSAMGIECGAHTVSHPQLDLVGVERARREVEQSRCDLEQRLGSPVRSFAYPHGFFSRPVRDLVVSAGFDSACAVRDAWSHVGEDRYRLSRLVVNGTTTADDLWTRLVSVPDRPAGRRVARQVGHRFVRRAQHVVQGAS